MRQAGRDGKRSEGPQRAEEIPAPRLSSRSRRHRRPALRPRPPPGGLLWFPRPWPGWPAPLPSVSSPGGPQDARADSVQALPPLRRAAPALRDRGPRLSARRVGMALAEPPLEPVIDGVGQLLAAQSVLNLPPHPAAEGPSFSAVVLGPTQLRRARPTSSAPPSPERSRRGAAPRGARTRSDGRRGPDRTQGNRSPHKTPCAAPIPTAPVCRRGRIRHVGATPTSFLSTRSGSGT